MVSFDDTQRSQRLNRPVILYTITTPSDTHRFTTNVIDVVFGGVTYSALTVIHDDEQTTQDPSGDELVIHLPISHPFVQRFAATGIPEQSVQVTVQELQTAASAAALTWSGAGQSMTINGHTAALRVPTATNDALKIQLPTLAAQRSCPHLLFDQNCAPLPGGTFPSGSASGTGGPVASAFTMAVHVASVSSDGNTITVSEGGLAAAYQFGKIIFGSELRTISSQTGSVFLIDTPFVSLSIGQEIQIQQGCDKAATTCRDKFNNVANFGSYPQLNSSVNLWSPTGLGIQQ